MALNTMHMNRWLHVGVHSIKRKDVIWGMRRNGSERYLITSKNKSWVMEHAHYFAEKHKLMFFEHDTLGGVVHVADYNGAPNMEPSQSFKEHYNTSMHRKLVEELPNLKTSTNVKELKVRARFKGKEEPAELVVHAIMHSGQKVRFKEPRYMFPTPEFIAKIGLLI